MTEINDEKLISRYLKGDKKSLEILVKKYLKPIHNFVWQYVKNKPDAEEMTQEVFVKAWRNLKKFDRTRNFKTWIFAIAKNTSIDFLRKKKTIPFSEFENEKGENTLVDNLADLAPLPAEVYERTNNIEALNKTTRQLSPKYQKVLNLHYDKQLSFREIAESLGRSIHTVKNWHRRAVIQLKKILPKF